jgi:hypothetical protein
MMTATPRSMTRPGPRSARRRVASGRRAPQRPQSCPASRLAAQKLASGFFRSEPATRTGEVAAQLTSTHQENSVTVVTMVLGCAVAPNNALQQPVSNGGWALSSSPNSSHHVETDGKGGLKVVIASGDVPFAYTNPVILNSIKIHEGTHILDAYSANNGIANDKPAGLVLGADPTTRALSEYNAIQRQLDYFARQLTNPGSLTPNQVLQIQYYQVHVENYRATIAGGPRQPMPPMPPSGP